ncbi:MAG: glycoside hydrolase family 44 protein [Thermoanaerobaculia bacterium]
MLGRSEARKVPFLLVAILVLSAPAGAADTVVYDDQLRNGFQDWTGAWTTYSLTQTSVVHTGTKAISFVPGSDYSGVFFHSPTSLSPASYAKLSFWVNGGATGGQKLQVALLVSGSATGTEVQLGTYFGGGGVPANAWSLVEVTMATFGPPGSFDGVWIRSSLGSNQPTVYVDDLVLVAAAAPPPPGTVTVAVDPAQDRRAVSPLIFGVNWGGGAQLARMKFPVRRWGGTPTSRYNWQNNAWNAGNDYLYLNNAAGPSADAFITETRNSGSEPLMAVPILGWVAKDSFSYGFSIGKYGAMHGNECSLFGNFGGCNGDMGDGFHADMSPVAGNDPLDTSTASTSALATAWKAHIAANTGSAAAGGVKYFGLDNEPMLWNYSHRDVHPAGVTYDEHWQKGRDTAAALKAADPAVQVVGPNEWGWCGWLDSSADYSAPGGSCFVLGPDAAAHGNQPFSAWWLAQAKAYEQAHGVRLVDYFSLHYYPQGDAVALSDPNGDTAATQALRLRALKELYDPGWVSESWIDQPIDLIPRMRQWIADNYPGTKLAIGEYNFGDVGVSSALAQAEALAIFAREGVDLALRWEAPAEGTLIEDAFSLYMNYDGAGAKVSGTAVRCVSSDVDSVGAYTIQGANGTLHVLLFNKATSSVDAQLSAAGGFGPTASLYRFSGAARLAAAGSAITGGGPFTLTLPARSATLAVIAPAVVTPPPTVLTFTATPQALPAAGSSTLAWTTQDTDAVTVSGVAGSFAPNASTDVSVAATTTYTMTATGPGGTANAQVTVTVQPAPPGGVSFYTLTPCRIVDTRVGTADGLHAPILAPSPAVRTLAIPAGLCGIPADAGALSVNYTVVSPASAGDLKAWAATEAAQPVATVLSFGAGRTRANNGILRLSSDGTRSFDLLLAANQSAHFVLDVNGYFR